MQIFIYYVIMHLLQKQFFAFGSNFKQSSSYGPVIFFFWLAIFHHFVRNILSQIPSSIFLEKKLPSNKKELLKLPKT